MLGLGALSLVVVGVLFIVSLDALLLACPQLFMQQEHAHAQ